MLVVHTSPSPNQRPDLVVDPRRVSFSPPSGLIKEKLIHGCPKGGQEGVQLAVYFILRVGVNKVIGGHPPLKRVGPFSGEMSISVGYPISGHFPYYCRRPVEGACRRSESNGQS